MAPSGIRAEVTIRSPGSCPIAETTAAAGAAATSVSRSVGPDDATGVTEEFLLDDDATVEGEDVERVFAYGSRYVYRFNRDRGTGCPCEAIERHDCPVVDVRADDGNLHLAFHAPDVERLQAVVGDVEAAFDDVAVRRLLRSGEDRSASRLVLVDSARLTDRQREVLTTAHEMGYFDHPKGANAGEVAAALDIARSTFTEHLSAAQSKLFSAILDG